MLASAWKLHALKTPDRSTNNLRLRQGIGYFLEGKICIIRQKVVLSYIHSVLLHFSFLFLFLPPKKRAQKSQKMGTLSL